MTESLLDIKNLTIDMIQDHGSFSVIRDLSMKIRPGEIYGLAGESGCGKSTLAKGILRILSAPAVIRKGSILYRGEQILNMEYPRLRSLRWNEISIVFQSAMSCLNPVVNIGSQMSETILAHTSVSKEEALLRAGDMLEMVGISRQHLRSYAHTLSGGMKQRVLIATALLLKPQLLILDEPTTALDVLVQSQILKLLRRLQAEQGFTILMISHDLPLLLDFCDRVGIMYAGQLIEEASSQQIKAAASHPYTLGLLNSFPRIERYDKRLQGIPGHPPHPATIGEGCAFRPRCQQAQASCQQTRPSLLGSEHRLACLYPQANNFSEIVERS